MKLLALSVLIALVAGMGWQHLRYLNARRGPVQDQQPLLYGGETFHVVSLLALAPGADALESLRKLRADLENSGQAKMVYAGRGAGVGLQSEQLGDVVWDAVVLVQYPSRETFDALAATADYPAAFARFGAHHSHGMIRSALPNLAIPMMLLGLRAYQIVTFQPSHYPLVPADPDARDPRTSSGGGGPLAGMNALRHLSEDALVVVNLLKHGTAEAQAADRGYGLKMAGLFAEGGHGPMHIGKAVSLDGKSEFDRVAIVYYPGVDYMQRLMGSTFFNGIVGGKQPGDTVAVPTVPVLARL